MAHTLPPIALLEASRDSLALFAGAAVVLAGLAVGLRDVLRFSPTRLWTISSVAFRQSIRRRVPWITPLVMLGVVIAAQLAHPVDYRDDIRQTARFALFATGMLTVLVGIILAATDLPKEIETRVIHTIATKPVTRLEIVAGKVLGFARLSAAILLIMGAFTWTYLHLKSARLQALIRQRLDAGQIDHATRQSLEHYRNVGLLLAHAYAEPQSLQIYASYPSPGQGRWSLPSPEQRMLVPLAIPSGAIPSADPSTAAPLFLRALVRWRAVTTRPTSQPAGPAALLALVDANENTVVSSSELGLPADGLPLMPPPGESRQPGEIVGVISPSLRPRLAAMAGRPLYVLVEGTRPGFHYGVEASSVQLAVPDTAAVYGAPRDAAALHVARSGTHGQQVRGDATGRGPVAVLSYRGPPPPAVRGVHPLELYTGIERSGGELTLEDERTTVEVEFRDAATGTLLHSQRLYPESRRTLHFAVPPAATGTGDFDVVLRVLTGGHWIGLRSGPKGASLRLVLENQSFAWNLFKSLSILWLLSLLVISIAVFCSTFLSWPVAVVLTVVILMGRWGVSQVEDVMTPGFGRSFVQDIFRTRDPAKARVVSEGVDELGRALQAVARFLPDVSRFTAIEPVATGTAVAPSTLGASARVALGFSIPLILLGYVFLRYKEVAP